MWVIRLYKLSQKGLWSDTSPWCSLSERARTLIYNSLLVTRQTQHFFFFAKRNAGCQCCFLLKVSVNLAYFYVLISPPSLPPTTPPPHPAPEDFYNSRLQRGWLSPCLSYKISMCNQMVTSEKARKIIRNWTKRKWKCSFISRVHHIQITLTLVGFWLATRV